MSYNENMNVIKIPPRDFSNPNEDWKSNLPHIYEEEGICCIGVGVDENGKVYRLDTPEYYYKGKRITQEQVDAMFNSQPEIIGV